MSVNSLDNKQEPVSTVAMKKQPKRRGSRKRWWLAALLPLWVLSGWGLAQALLVGVLLMLRAADVPIGEINIAVLSTVLAAFSYILSTIIVIGVPWWIKKYRTTVQDVGLSRLPSWLDIGLAPAGAIVYLICSVALLALVKAYIPSIDLDQVQETGFGNLVHYYEYILAFITLIIIAPIFEEILFRGYLYGKLRKIVPIWLAVLIVSALFAFVHGQWNVAIDVFALSIVLCSLREVTGSIWAGILLHMTKNSLAFYFLFVNPDILRTMGG